MNSEQVTDELSIRRLVDTFCEGVNSRDPELWASVWEERDPSFSFGAQTLRGKDAIVSGFVRGIANYDFLFQIISNGLIDLSGDSATGRWQLVEIGRTRAGASSQLLGRCSDSYIRSDNGWRIQHRVVEHVYKGDAPLTGRMGLATD